MTAPDPAISASAVGSTGAVGSTHRLAADHVVATTGPVRSPHRAAAGRPPAARVVPNAVNPHGGGTRPRGNTRVRPTDPRTLTALGTAGPAGDSTPAVGTGPAATAASSPWARRRTAAGRSSAADTGPNAVNPHGGDTRPRGNTRPRPTGPRVLTAVGTVDRNNDHPGAEWLSTVTVPLRARCRAAVDQASAALAVPDAVTSHGGPTRFRGNARGRPTDAQELTALGTAVREGDRTSAARTGVTATRLLGMQRPTAAAGWFRARLREAASQPAAASAVPNAVNPHGGPTRFRRNTWTQTSDSQVLTALGTADRNADGSAAGRLNPAAPEGTRTPGPRTGVAATATATATLGAHRRAAVGRSSTPVTAPNAVNPHGGDTQPRGNTWPRPTDPRILTALGPADVRGLA